MNLRRKLSYALSVIGISLSVSVMADLYVHGSRNFTSAANSLNIYLIPAAMAR